MARPHLRRAGHQTAERKRPRGCESKARRHARAQPVVSALAAVWGVLPLVSALLHIPVRMWRPARAREALGFSPLVQARRADGSRIERVPLAPAGAEPFVFLAGRSAAEGAPDAGAIGVEVFLLVGLANRIPLTILYAEWPT